MSETLGQLEVMGEMEGRVRRDNQVPMEQMEKREELDRRDNKVIREVGEQRVHGEHLVIKEIQV